MKGDEMAEKTLHTENTYTPKLSVQACVLAVVVVVVFPSDDILSLNLQLCDDRNSKVQYSNMKLATTSRSFTKLLPPFAANAKRSNNIMYTCHANNFIPVACAVGVYCVRSLKLIVIIFNGASSKLQTANCHNHREIVHSLSLSGPYCKMYLHCARGNMQLSQFTVV